MHWFRLLATWLILSHANGKSFKHLCWKMHEFYSLCISTSFIRICETSFTASWEPGRFWTYGRVACSNHPLTQYKWSASGISYTRTNFNVTILNWLYTLAPSMHFTFSPPTSLQCGTSSLDYDALWSTENRRNIMVHNTDIASKPLHHTFCTLDLKALPNSLSPLFSLHPLYHPILQLMIGNSAHVLLVLLSQMFGQYCPYPP